MELQVKLKYTIENLQLWTFDSKKLNIKVQ